MPNNEDIKFCEAAVRLNMWTAQQAKTVVQHLQAYEQQGQSISIEQLAQIQQQNGKVFLTSEQIQYVRSYILAQSQGQHLQQTTTHAGHGSVSGQTAETPTNVIQEGGKIEVGKLFGSYMLEKELGRGGMGAVYKATDTKLQRAVALKVILAGQQVTQKQVDRFMLEARSIAQIDHPNIIRVFDVGEKPQNYFTMEYIEGQELSDWLKKKQVKFKDMASLIQKVAEGLYVAHQKSIIHRDIKPSNVMVDKESQPHLMDFGLAKSEDSNLSQAGDLLGTPAYMSPEQANGEEADHRSDLYSLGATLYEMLGGRAPFQGESVYNIIYQIMNNDPVSPSALNPDVPRELEAICLKSMERNPKKRYQSARAMAKDLKNYIEDRPITASPPTKWSSFVKWTKRNRGLAISIATVASIILASLIIVLQQNAIVVQKNAELTKQKKFAEAKKKEAEEKKKEVEKQKKEVEEQKREVEEQKKIAEEQKRVADEKARFANRQKYNLQITLANIQGNQGHTLTLQNSITDARKALKETKEQGTNPWEIRWLENRSKSYNRYIKSRIDHINEKDRDQKIIQCRGDTVQFIGNKYLLYCTRNGKRWVDEIQLFNLELNQIVWQKTAVNQLTKEAIEHDRQILQIKSMNLSPDKKSFVTTSEDGRVCLWRVADGKLVTVFNDPKVNEDPSRTYPGEARFASFSSDRKYIISVGERSLERAKNANKALEINLWSVQSKKLVKTIQIKAAKQLKDIHEFTNSGLYKFSAQNLIKNTSNISKMYGVYLLPKTPGKNPEILISDSQSYWYSVDLKTGDSNHFQKKQKQYAHRLYVLHCAFSKDAKMRFFASAGEDGKVVIWNRQNKIAIGSLENGHQGGINSCDFHHTNKFMVTGGEDGRLHLWQLDYFNNGQKLVAKIIRTFLGHRDAILSCRFKPNSDQIVSIGSSGDIFLWDMEGRPQPQVIDVSKARKGILQKMKTASLTSCTFFSNAPFAATSIGTLTNNVQIWNTKTLKEVKTWTNKEGKSYPLSNLAGVPGGCDDVAVSPDNRYIASGGDSAKKINVYKLDQGEEDKEWRDFWRKFRKQYEDFFRFKTYRMKFHPQQNWLLWSSGQGNSFIFDVEAKKVLWHTQIPDARGCYDAAFSPSGKYVAFANKSGSQSNLAIYTTVGLKLLSYLPKQQAVSVDFHPTNENIVALGTFQELAILNWKEKKLLANQSQHKGLIVSTRFFKLDGACRIITASFDGTLVVWRYLETETSSTNEYVLEKLIGLEGDGEVIVGAAISKDKKQVISIGENNIAAIWTIAD